MKPDQTTIDNVLDNLASLDEARQVARWFSTNEGRLYLSERIERESKAVPDGDILNWIDHPICSDGIYKAITQRALSRHSRLFRFSRVAALLIPFLLLSCAVVFMADRMGLFQPVDYHEFYARNGEQLHLILQDGTKVHLNSDSRLRFPKTFTLFERRVQLKGEAFFSVTKGHLRPFTVDLSGIEITVTGTKFNVKAYTGDSCVFVALEEGSVCLQGNDTRQFPLKKGESAHYDRRTKQCNISPMDDASALTAWRNNSLNLYRTPLKEVLSMLSRQYDVCFEVADSTLLSTRFTLSTSKVHIDDILTDLEKISRTRFISNNEGSYLVICSE